MARPVCPSVLKASSSFSSQAHLTTSAPPSTSRATGTRYPASYPPRSVGGLISRDRFLSPFGRRHSLLGHPSPAQAISVPHGQPTNHGHDGQAGPRRGFHVPHAQDTTGKGALCSPGTGGTQSRPGFAHRPAPGASQRHVPAPRHNLHRCAALCNEPSTRVQAIRPSDLPLARSHRMDRQRLRLSPELRTPRLLAAHVGAGTDHLEHGSEISDYGIDRTSNLADLLDTCDLASHTKPETCRRRRAAALSLLLRDWRQRKRQQPIPRSDRRRPGSERAPP